MSKFGEKIKLTSYDELLGVNMKIRNKRIRH